VPTAVLILPTGTYRAEEYLAAARRLGVEVVTASERPQALAGQMGDRFLHLPLDDPARAAEVVVERAARLPIDAVVAVDDEGLLVAALASERLGLRHSPPAAVRLTRDKAAMRRCFEAAGVPQPRFSVVEPGEPTGAARAAQQLGCPVVVKPCSLSGSRGVIRADSPAEAAAAAARIAPILAEAGEPPLSPLLVEELVAGAEVAVEAVASAGSLDLVAVFDKPDPLDGPFFEETIYVTPSRLPTAALERVERAVREAVNAIGLTDGPVHAEARVAGAGSSTPRPAVLEVAARTIGGRCSKALALEGGATLEDLVVAVALALPAPPARLAGPAGVLMIPIPSSGTLREVRHVGQVRALPGVTGVELTVPVGRAIRALPEGDRYLGFVFAAGGTPEEVEDALRRAEELLEVEVEPVPHATVAR
jgi:biotin carboxylase